MFQDLRDWINEIERIHQLKRIDNASWDLEMGAISEALSFKNGPAVLFDNIPGYQVGYRVVSNTLMNPSTVGLTFGLRTDYTLEELVSVFSNKIPEWEEKAYSGDFKPKEVKSGPIMENAHNGDDVDILEFPVPKWHEYDGGRYIGTGTANITRDPDSGLINFGCYRVMVHDKNTVGFHTQPAKHGRLHYEKYEERGEACPVAFTFGSDPLIFAVSGNEIPRDLSEYDYVGAVRGKPIEVIKGPVTGIPIPANAEIAAEGEILPHERRPEGPFGEGDGYYGCGILNEPVVKIKAIYHRNNPIILGAPPHKPPAGVSYFRAVVKSALHKRALERSGIPDIRGVWAAPIGRAMMLNIISIKQRYAGHAKQAALALAASFISAVQRFIIVVDEDIDPTNLDDVLWAMTTRCDPETQIDIVRRIRSGPTDPRIRKPKGPGQSMGAAFHGSVAIIDACRPYEWIADFPRVVQTSPELMEKVRKKWPL